MDEQPQPQFSAAEEHTGGGEKQKKGTDNRGGGLQGQITSADQHTQSRRSSQQPTRFISGMDDPKIQKLMETMKLSEEEIYCALQECDIDLNRTVIFLLDTLPVGAFATTSKEKKIKSQNKEQSDSATGDGDWNNGDNVGSVFKGGNGLSADSKDRRSNRPGNQRPCSGPGGRGVFRDSERGGTMTAMVSTEEVIYHGIAMVMMVVLAVAVTKEDLVADVVEALELVYVVQECGNQIEHRV